MSSPTAALAVIKGEPGEGFEAPEPPLLPGQVRRQALRSYSSVASRDSLPTGPGSRRRRFGRTRRSSRRSTSIASRSPAQRLASAASASCDSASGLAGGSPLLVEFLPFEADPFAVMDLTSAEGGRNHGHAAGGTDRWTVIRIHLMSIPQVPAREAVCSHSPGRASSRPSLRAVRGATTFEVSPARIPQASRLVLRTGSMADVRTRRGDKLFRTWASSFY